MIRSAVDNKRSTIFSDKRTLRRCKLIPDNKMAITAIQVVAFLSYAHLDDEGSISEISLFHELLQKELAIQTGRRVQIFFDRKSIGWGKRWSKVIEGTIESASFLVPIITPSFFQSDACRREYDRFLATEEKGGRSDLVLPVYYVKCREMNFASGIDPLVDDILSRQYRDWRPLRHQPRESGVVRQAFADLAASMAETFFEIEDERVLPIPSFGPSPSLQSVENAAHISLLDREINYDNLILYSFSEFPDLPVSKRWSEALLEDIDLSRYRSVRDIDKEVKFAKEQVDKYAAARPRIFQTSTDFITKSLIFVDSDFRATHDVGPETVDAAIKANITKY